MDWFIGECMRGTVYEEKEGYETKVPVRGREMRFDRDRKIRSSGAPWPKRVREERRDGCCSIVGWCVVTPAAKGGRLRRGSQSSTGSYPLLAVSPRPLPLPPMTRDRTASLMESSFFSRKMFIGGLSWQTSPGMWQTRNSDRIPSTWQLCTMDANGIHRLRTSPVLQERESDRCRYYFLLRVVAVIIYRLIQRHAFFSRCAEYHWGISLLTSWKAAFLWRCHH